MGLRAWTSRENLVSKLTSPDRLQKDFYERHFLVNREMGLFPFDHEFCLQSNPELGQFVRNPTIRNSHGYCPSEMCAQSFGYQYIIFGPRNLGIRWRISVSGIRFDGIYYISGMRVSEQSNESSLKRSLVLVTSYLVQKFNYILVQPIA